MANGTDSFESFRSEVNAGLFPISAGGSATGASAYNILQNNGARAGQAVFHVHFHIIPRFDDDGLAFQWHPSELKKDAAQELVSAMRAALAEDA